MDDLLLAARLALAAVFLASATAKLLDRGGARQAVLDVGLPEPWTAYGTLLLPLAELAVAAALVPAATAWPAALAALALLALFSGAIGVSLARGRDFDCHCFGRLYSESVGWRALARNGLLAIPAALIAWAGPGRSGTLADGALAAASALLVLLMVEVDRRRAGAGEREALAPVGERSGLGQPAPEASAPRSHPAPDFRLPTLDGGARSLGDLLASGRPVVLVFTDPDCATCGALLPEVAAWQRALEGAVTVAVIGTGSAEANRARREAVGLTEVLLQGDWEVADAYGVERAPSAVLVRPDGTLRDGVASGAQVVRALMSRFASRPATATTSITSPNGRHDGQEPEPVPSQTTGADGARAPRLRLPTVAGGTVDLADSEGRGWLVVFWSPTCRFSRRLLPRLQAWEAEAPSDAPALLVVSSGSLDANRDLGLRAPVALDGSGTVAQAFGAKGTPAAVLLAADGSVASPVVVGIGPIMALAERGAIAAPDPD